VSRTRAVSSSPTGLCQCGCGQTTPIAKKTRTSIGHVKGEHVRFVLGHGNRVGRYRAAI
jgi:hypothetical protein